MRGYMESISYNGWYKATTQQVYLQLITVIPVVVKTGSINTNHQVV